MKRLLFALLWLVLWTLLAAAVNKPLFLPGPVDTVRALFGLAGQKTFWLDCLWTVIRWAVSVAIAFILGSQLAWAAYNHNTVEDFLALPVRFFKSVPIMAVIFYIVLLVSSDWVAVIVCFFMCFPVVYTNILAGLRSIDENMIKAARVFGVSKWSRQRLLYVPATRPAIGTALSLSGGMAWKAVIAAEIFSIPAHSLGYEMLDAKYYFNTAELFAYIVVIIILARLSELLLKQVTGKEEGTE